MTSMENISFLHQMWLATNNAFYKQVGYIIIVMIRYSGTYLLKQEVTFIKVSDGMKIWEMKK